ncbi:protein DETOXIFICATION 3 isoform X1 [Ziziphus jujuba]|uniref:Protein DETOXIFICATION n=1 Tax=Ziziphus jujuba TaxID=326968 RepID=A0ABM3IHX2_ZIZJJ|nr:protein DETOXIFICATION 3 isoform X1 [Ziziphus jujuba]
MATEEPLLAKTLEERKWRSAITEELKKLISMAAPMMVVSVSQYLLQVVSVMMAGHIDELSLSGVAIASSFTNVTGFSLLVGMAGALETLCGQAYGAGQYHKFGMYAYCAVISLMLVCLPISLLWVFIEDLLILIGQDPLISHQAGKYAILLIPALFAHSILQSLIRYFLSQGLILPMLISSCSTLCFHIPVCWVLVYKLELGSTGAAMSICLSYWLSVIFLSLYMKYSSKCNKTRVAFSTEVFSSIKEFICFAVPSAVMVCLEWWSFELLILLSGLLPNPKLETSVLSICLTTTSLHYFVPYGVGAAASTRVSNELGAGNSRGAQIAVHSVMMLAVIEAVVLSTIVFCCRSVVGYAYSNVKEVVDYVETITPLLSLSFIMDSLMAVLSGIARGCGWQNLGAYANLSAYYLVGIPVAIILGFLVGLRGIGLWIGILTGSTVQVVLLALLTFSTNWQKQAIKARERIFKETSNGSLA